MKSEVAVASPAQTRVLSEEQAERIVQGALEVLQETGVRVESGEALGVLKAQGAIMKGDVARIPRDLVRVCLESVPKKLTIYGRDGAGSLLLGYGNTYYAPSMTCPNVLDPSTDERRPFGRKDAAVVGHLADALPNVDYVIGGGIIEDVTPILAAAYEFAELANNTSKPLFGWAHNEVVLGDIYQMACALAGGEDAFHEKPNCLIFINPISPLVHSPEVAGRVVFAARNSVPIIIWPFTLAGGTVPVTPAGGMVVALAEALSALAINQSVRPGAPFIFGATVSRLDMRTGLSVGGPRSIAAAIGLADVMRHLGVISYLSGGGTTSKTVDQQAAMQVAASLMALSQTGADLLAGMGSTDAGMTMSPAFMVLADDIVDMCRRVRQGIEVSDETLALDVIKRIGPGGHFLMEDHTRKHFREEQWEPALLDLGTYDDWDGSTLGERVRARVETILASHKPRPLPDSVQAALDETLHRAEAREARSR